MCRRGTGCAGWLHVPTWPVNVRRLLMVGAQEDFLGDDVVRASSVRTLFMLGASSASTPASLLASIAEFRLLRVLDLEGAPVDRLPEELSDDLYLRYLSLRNTTISKLPKSVRKLMQLQMLDLKGTYVLRRTSATSRYYSGRHQPYYYALGVMLPQGVGQLRELQKLTYVAATQGRRALAELAGLTRLKRLGIVELRRGVGACLCAAVARMTELLSLSASSAHVDEHLHLSSLYPAPPRLERLYLRGPSPELPRWVFSLWSLARIRLRWSRLSEESVRELQSLPVIELALIQAYDDATLHFARGFVRLQDLSGERENQPGAECKKHTPVAGHVGTCSHLGGAWTRGEQKSKIRDLNDENQSLESSRAFNSK